MNAKETLQNLTELFLYYLEELSALPRNDFIYGEMNAYVECLEIISRCDIADKRLKQNIAKKYGI